MLLASLHGEDEGTTTLGIGSGTDKTTGHLAHQFVLGAKVADIRSTVVHRDTEALSIAASDVGTPFARSAEHTKRAGYAIDSEERLVCMAKVGKASEVLDNAIVVGLADDKTCHVILLDEFLSHSLIHHAISSWHLHQLYAMIVGIGLDNAKHLRIACSRDEHLVALFGIGHAHQHSLGSSCRAIVHRSIRQIHTSEVGHHGLILEDIL